MCLLDPLISHLGRCSGRENASQDCTRLKQIRVIKRLDISISYKGDAVVHRSSKTIFTSEKRPEKSKSSGRGSWTYSVAISITTDRNPYCRSPACHASRHCERRKLAQTLILACQRCQRSTKPRYLCQIGIVIHRFRVGLDQCGDIWASPSRTLEWVRPCQRYCRLGLYSYYLRFSSWI